MINTFRCECCGGKITHQPNYCLDCEEKMLSEDDCDLDLHKIAKIFGENVYKKFDRYECVDIPLNSVMFAHYTSEGRFQIVDASNYMCVSFDLNELKAYKIIKSLKENMGEQ